MSTYETTVRAAWATRGLLLTEGRLEPPGIYAPVVVVPNGDAVALVTRWEAALVAAGFTSVGLDTLGERAGVLPSIASAHDGRAARRGKELVVLYAMRGGLPETDGSIPVRGALFLLTRELLAHWSARRLDEAGEVQSADDDLLVLAVSSDAGFDEVRAALLRSGAHETVSVASHAAAARRRTEAVLAAGGLSPREVQRRLAERPVTAQRVTLVDRDGATLTVDADHSRLMVRIARQVGEV